MTRRIGTARLLTAGIVALLLFAVAFVWTLRGSQAVSSTGPLLAGRDPLATVSIPTRPGPADAVLTQRGDLTRLGWYSTETHLTVASVGGHRFGRRASLPVDGKVYAQPLYVPRLRTAGGRVRDVVIVATEHDTVYAFDADATGSARPLWRISLLMPGARTFLAATDRVANDRTCDSIAPEVGITSTPVIDWATHRLYVMALDVEHSVMTYRLHAIDLTTGRPVGAPAGETESLGTVAGRAAPIAGMAGRATESSGTVARMSAPTSVGTPAVAVRAPRTAPTESLGTVAGRAAPRAAGTESLGTVAGTPASTAVGFPAVTVRAVGTAPTESLGTVAGRAAPRAVGSPAAAARPVGTAPTESLGTVAGVSAAVAGEVAGSGLDAVSGRVTFRAGEQQQRMGLALVGGTIYAGFSSWCGWAPYHGWVFGYRAADLSRDVVYNDSPGSYGGGLWESESGISADGHGHLFVVTGNGAFNVNTGGTDAGDTVMEMVPHAGTLWAIDTFTPFDQQCRAQHDQDLGSGSPLMVPGHDEIILSSKTGAVYVLDQSRLGGYHTVAQACRNRARTDVDRIRQELTIGTVPGGMWGTWGYWRGVGAEYVYGSGATGRLTQWRLAPDGTLVPRPVSRAPESLSYPGAIPVVSSNGSGAGTGIVWAIDQTHGAVLRAYDAADLGHEIWNSATDGARDGLHGFDHFDIPTIAGGHVLVGDQNRLEIYGTLPA